MKPLLSRQKSLAASVVKQYQYLQRLITQYQVFDKLLKLNQHIFPHLYVIASMLLTIELVTYRGFTFRYLYLDARVVMAVAVACYLIIFIQKLRTTVKLPAITVLVLEFNKLSIIPLLLLNYLLLSLDLYYYPNYVYSKFHINTGNVQLLLSFNILLLILQVLQSSPAIAHFILQRLSFKKAFVNAVFLLLVGAFMLPNLQIVTRWMYGACALMIRSIGLSWEERFIFLNGGEKSTGWITHYTQFVNRHVAERGVIFIPPQKEAWQMEGNPYYIRWFIYPRFTVQSQDLEAPIPDDAEYVLITHGAWPGMTEYGWPRIAIPAEKIEVMHFIERESMVESQVVGQAYDPETMANKWGIIKLKK